MFPDLQLMEMLIFEEWLGSQSYVIALRGGGGGKLLDNKFLRSLLPDK